MNEIKITPRYYSGKTITDILQQEIDNADLLMRILSRLRYAESVDGCEDAVSRQGAIDAVMAMQTYKLSEGDDMLLIDKADVMTELMALPSTQERPKSNPSLTQDAISRRDAIEAMKERRDAAKQWYDEADDDNIMARADSAIASFIECILTLKKMPSVQPEPYQKEGD